MQRGAIIVLVCLAALLCWPGPCHANGLSPAYYPLGPYPFFFLAMSRGYLLALVAVILLHGLILRSISPEASLLRNLFRAAIILALSKTIESVPGWILLTLNPGRAWGSDSLLETLYTPCVIFAAGWTANAVAVGTWLPTSVPDSNALFLTSGILSATSYMVLLVTTMGLLQGGLW